ncbi:phosphoethanolamine--lipid A transferase EptA [Marinagarivorans cellulosilyticus]|uniref:Lipid A ethanolaminephosphotransferase n=1 Tax=Marinagarivorans cellulosilyticus TaxID=2721545 RepID=A0AAN1WEY9_9GAMM|nr:phosphoethanolamine--lipid A transferase EptA [Marinagarivorans cellulosilyticus]BCD96357.1 lipid A ethanolaminephosphotransferase [Marinagarivorans cellulosilyticus]
MKPTNTSSYNSRIEKIKIILKTPWNVSPIKFISIATLANILLYHLPLWSFLESLIELNSRGGLGILILLTCIQVLMSFLVFVCAYIITPLIIKPLLIIFAILNSFALYFTVTYNVILDRSMIGNILNTNASEALDFFGPKLWGYVLFFGLIPSVILWRTRITKAKRIILLGQATPIILACIAYIYLSSSSWLWIDKHAKVLGGMIMPWSYVINTVRYKSGEYQQTREQILLPPAESTNNEKTIIILVIGESARSKNFSLYGYKRNTNPHLSKTGILALRGSTSCSTYTTASLRCILAHQEPASFFATQHEPLPSYLQRHDVDVIWRTNNWGEPRLNIESYTKSTDLKPLCNNDLCEHDEILLSGLEKRIRNSNKQKIFIVLHQTGSHGPSYYSKYPIKHETFRPVCKTVDLKDCTAQDLLNAYDNTIVFTDYLLNRTINILKSFSGVSTSLIYISDHGESLGEHGIYLHGTPLTVAPKEQIEIPFLVWMSERFMEAHKISNEKILNRKNHSQSDIFHSVLSGFNMTSDVYLEEFDIFSQMER